MKVYDPDTNLYLGCVFSAYVDGVGRVVFAEDRDGDVDVYASEAEARLMLHILHRLAVAA